MRLAGAAIYGRVKRDCFRDTNFHRRGCGRVSYTPPPQRHAQLRFYLRLCGFADRLFHYACFLCRKIRPENNNHNNTSHHPSLCFCRTHAHARTQYVYYCYYLFVCSQLPPRHRGSCTASIH